MEKTTMTNRKYAAQDTMFQNACAKADEILETLTEYNIKKGHLCNPRQASKFRRGKGIVYKLITQ